MRRWGCWRRVAGVGEGGRWRGRRGHSSYPRKGVVDASPSPAPTSVEPPPASAKGRVDSGRTLPPRSVTAAAAASSWGRSRFQHGRAYPPAQPPVHPVAPCTRGLSTEASASSRLPLASLQIEDDKGDKEEEDGAEGLLGVVRGVEGGSEEEFEGSWGEEWEEEDDAEPEIGDGGDGGGIVLGNVAWGERALSIANETLRLHFDEDTKMFAFKISPRGYLYVRLDKLSDRFGCPKMEEIEKFSTLYTMRLEESGENGELPTDLALEVSSPGAERLLRVPEDLDRFKEMPMLVHYMEENPESSQSELKDGVFLLDAVDEGVQHCVWKLADVRENRDPLSKGRPLSRKRRDWRLEVPFEMLKRVMLYVP